MGITRRCTDEQHVRTGQCVGARRIPKRRKTATTKTATSKPKLYIPKRLDEVMSAEDIVRGQRFTKATHERFKAKKSKHRKRLQREVAKQSLLGRDVARFMRECGLEKLPMCLLRGVNDDWDCDLPRIRVDSAISFWTFCSAISRRGRTTCHTRT